MSLKIYLRRSVKYFVALCVLCMAVIALNLVTGIATLSLEETLYVMFHTTRGLLMPAVIVLLALFYPWFGFTVRRVEGDLAADREQLLNAFQASGYRLEGEAKGTLRFRARGFGKRILMLGEDEIEVSQYGRLLVLKGIRRGVARVEYRLDSYLHMKRND